MPTSTILRIRSVTVGGNEPGMPSNTGDGAQIYLSVNLDGQRKALLGKSHNGVASGKCAPDTNCSRLVMVIGGISGVKTTIWLLSGACSSSCRFSTRGDVCV
jgi:hypothetical protein